MAQIVIEIPDGATTKQKIEALLKALEPINLQREAILAQIAALRRGCPHKNARHGTDISGGPDGHCYDCGYSW